MRTRVDFTKLIRHLVTVVAAAVAMGAWAGTSEAQIWQRVVYSNAPGPLGRPWWTIYGQTIVYQPGPNGPGTRSPQLNQITGVEVCAIDPPLTCGPPTVSFTATSFTIDWGQECVPPNTVVRIRIQSTAPIASVSGAWQNTVTTTASQLFPVSSCPEALPAASGVGIALLIASLGMIGLLVFRRRHVPLA